MTTTNAECEPMGELQDLWDEVEHAVADSMSNSEGRASAWYLEHHFRKAGLGVYRLPDDPPASADALAVLHRARKYIRDASVNSRQWQHRGETIDSNMVEVALLEAINAAIASAERKP